MTTTVSVGELIAEVEAHTPEASPVERVREAQTRAYTLAEAGEQLVGYFLSRAKESGASWAVIGEAEGLGARVLAELTEADVEAVTRARLHPGEETAPPARIPFTPRAKQTLDRAAEQSTELGHGFVGTEHLLLGLFGTGGIADDVLAGLGVDATSARERIRVELARLLDEHTADLPSVD